MTRRYLALGDSYTIGEGVEGHDRWPNVLQARRVDLVMPDVVATTGWTCDELLAALDEAAIEPPYDLVSLLIGVNDQYRGRDVMEHLAAFNTLLSRAIAYADGDSARVFVVSIPDWGVSEFALADARGPEAIAEAIDAYNQSQRELCQLRGIAYADITAISRACAGDSDQFVEDRLHPSASQYRRWLEQIEPVVASVLARG